MSGKQILIVVVLAILVGGGGTWLLYRYTSTLKSKPTTNDEAQNLVISATPSPMKLLTWNDEAGFSFQYPEGLKIDNHPNDNVNYANLTLTSGNEAGSIEILMKDDVYKSLDKWIKSDNNLATGTVIDTNLDDKKGKKVMTAKGELVIGVIDGGVLLTIMRDSSVSPSLESAWEKIVDTWQFVYPTPKVVNTQSDGGEVLEEEY